MPWKIAPRVSTLKKGTMAAKIALLASTVLRWAPRPTTSRIVPLAVSPKRDGKGVNSAPRGNTRLRARPGSRVNVPSAQLARNATAKESQVRTSRTAGRIVQRALSPRRVTARVLSARRERSRVRAPTRASSARQAATANRREPRLRVRCALRANTQARVSQDAGIAPLESIARVPEPLPPTSRATAGTVKLEPTLPKARRVAVTTARLGGIALQHHLWNGSSAMTLTVRREITRLPRLPIALRAPRATSAIRREPLRMMLPPETFVPKANFR
mmetsp:Transcript_29054/g.68932  ORF Transcript_29054/g.68932 Transcript_29054/m.68932 type:complete len:273 (-) Transcript_29054:2359-3177(-)